MIKKFKEFILENKSKEHLLTDIISKEEVEDQFLRLQEILGCSILIFCNKFGFYTTNELKKFKTGDEDIYYNIQTTNFSFGEKENLIKKEISCIMQRIENMYPDIKIDIWGEGEYTDCTFCDLIIRKRINQ